MIYFTAASIKRFVAVVKRLLVLHNCADYIFISLCIAEPIPVALKTEYRLKPVLAERMQPRKLHCYI